MNAYWVGVTDYSKLVVTFNHVGSPLIFFYGHHQGCLNNTTFSNLGLCAACWACFMCHPELCPTWVNHTFSFLNSSLSFTGGKHYQKITIPIFRLVLQNLLFQVTFLIFFSTALFSPYFLQVCLLLQYVGLLQPRNYLSLRAIVNWCRVAVSKDKSPKWVPSPLLHLFFYDFLKS